MPVAWLSKSSSCRGESRIWPSSRVVSGGVNWQPLYTLLRMSAILQPALIYHSFLELCRVCY